MPAPYSRPPATPWKPPAPAPSRSNAPVWAAVAGLAAAIAIVAVVIAIAVSKDTSGGTATSTSSSYPYSPTYSPSDSATPTSTYRPPADPEAAAYQQLKQFADRDRSGIAQFADHWIPQLSSKHATQPFTYDPEDRMTYDTVATLQEHQTLRQQYSALLTWSGDWTTYDHPDYWITVVPRTFPDRASVVSWCSSVNRDPDHCSPQILSTTMGPNGTH
jgi:hypothetical protein